MGEYHSKLLMIFSLTFQMKCKYSLVQAFSLIGTKLVLRQWMWPMGLLFHVYTLYLYGMLYKPHHSHFTMHFTRICIMRFFFTNFIRIYLPVADPGISKLGAQSRRGRIPRSGVCFEAPSHIPYVLVVRVVNKIHIINIVFWPKSKYMRVIQSKITKTIPQNFSNRGSRPTRQSWIRLCEQDKLNISYHGNRWHKLYCFCNMRIYKVVFKVSFEFKYFVEQNTWRVFVW